ncbi:hypothetical protein [Candidatus Chrysopegis kryptomonas]|jgi:hypothetical protein|uniref:Uncharacterized protein n=1 Tax=Candidatus Chryseopegocella kryptomonas TaxID=1633643 RepID=A0A0P1MSN8_9BACT|nr:hypothetical protein [Candidatus Chrysopegis kryptomonas]CUS98928.1 hypothetical protein JGI23_00569 [Candidatus Chrysopegis kryptomonas]
MKFKFWLLISLLVLVSSCQKENQDQFLPYINLTVDGKSFKIDSVLAVYDDSAQVMTLIGAKYTDGRLFSTIAIGFKFSTGMQIPKTYDATKKPIELFAIYVDSAEAVYSTATIDSMLNPSEPIGTGVLNLTYHNLQLHKIAGDFNLRLKEIDPNTYEPKTKLIQITGSFQTYYAFLVTGSPPPRPLKIK